MPFAENNICSNGFNRRGGEARRFNYGVNYVLMDLTTEADRRGDVNYDL
jgi:hypothetical protein